MSNIKEDFNLQSYNTFQVAASARYFIELSSIDDIRDFLSSSLAAMRPRFILGGGSNVLFTKDFEGVILHPTLSGVESQASRNHTVMIRVGAGESWDGFVEYCVNRNLGGIENLSLIPGTVGASPVQNIGAYGTEVGNLIESVEAIHLENGKTMKLSSGECRFSYRDSIFKNELKDNALITQVTFRLNDEPRFNTEYPGLELEMQNYPETSLQTIRQAIIAMRERKLPDPGKIGNAGSFFKNPMVSQEQASSLRRFFPDMPVYPLQDGRVKLSSAWLIEKSGWKGRKWGKTGTYKLQPLILVNHGGASGEEIYRCALKIQQAVMDKFAIRLEMEVNIL
jgi:UDP-N-acetylmuramate dehydrogenase